MDVMTPETASSNPNTKSSDTDVLTAGGGQDSQQPSSLERAGDGGKPLSPEEKAVDEAFREVFGDPETMKPPQDDFAFAENGTELGQAEQPLDAGDRLFDEMAEYVHQGNRIEQAQEEIQGGVRLPQNDVGTRHSAVGDLYGSASQQTGNSAINTTEGASSSAAEVNPQKNSAASTTKDIDPQNSTSVVAGENKSGVEVLPEHLLEQIKSLNQRNRDLIEGKQFVEVEGKSVFVDDSLFDPDQIDKRKRTNRQRMQQGLAPIGKDGKSVNIHHLNQKNEGAVAEISATEHQTGYALLHDNTGAFASLIDRAKFAKWRRNYWKQRSQNLP